MARPKEFDPDLAIAQAGEVFRRKGYASASTEDLVSAMGVGRGSLYATFGSKSELFALALSKYTDRQFAPQIEALNRAEDPMQAITAFFTDRAIIHGQPGVEFGCLVVNSTVELSPHDPEMAKLLSDYWHALEDAFFAAISKAQDQGDAHTDRSARDLARFCIALMRGMVVGAKMDRDPEIAKNVIETAMLALKPG
jgi:TetR/AcrR family transcriptional repressor of nem operon